MTTNKLTLKAGNNILKLMGKANQAKKRAQQEIIQLQKDPIYALPKLPPNTSDPSVISTYCQILANDALPKNSIKQSPLNANPKIKKTLGNKMKIRHSSLSFVHKSSFGAIQNNNFNQSTSLQGQKKFNQINELTNKYSFTEISQDSNINYFFEKIFEPEIALFMSGANKVISVISQRSSDQDNNFKRIDLSHISSYIMKTNKSLDIEKQRTYDVKYADQNSSSFELSENVSFLDSSISVITPNAPPFSYLFILNLVDEKEIMNFASIVHQVKSLKSNFKKDGHKVSIEQTNSIMTHYPPFRQICQLCKKNCCFSIILFLRQSSTEQEDKEAEKLANLFCEKKKSFLDGSIEDHNLELDGSVEDHNATTIENDNLKKFNNDDVNLNNEKNTLNHSNSGNASGKEENNVSAISNYEESFFADGSGDECHDDNDIITIPISQKEEIKKIDQDYLSLIIDKAESDLKETQNYVDKNMLNIPKLSHNKSYKKRNEVIEESSSEIETNKETTNHSSLFELLKTLNNSEKENKEKLEKINHIQDQLEIIKENLSTIKTRKEKIKEESEKVNLEIQEIGKQTENQVIENEKMKKNVREMITRTAQLKSKYGDLLNELHEKERNQREQQWKAFLDKEEELKKKVTQSESKWRKELENQRNLIFFKNEKENQNSNEII